MNEEKRLKKYHLRRNHNEEYAMELTPRHLQVKKSENNDLLSRRTDTGVIVGYIALFIALFSIAFYPIVFGAFGVIMGLLAVRYGARTLGYTAIGFGAFSLLFSLLYPLFLSIF